MIRKARTYSMVIALAFLMACGNILSGVIFGYSLGKPIFEDLQTQGVITGDQKLTIFADIDDGIAITKKGIACANAVTGDKNQKRFAKAKCYLTVATDSRSILDRHHIDVIDSEKARRYLVIVNDVIVALEAYFNQVTGNSAAATTGKAADPDKELERKMNDAKKRMKALENEK